MEIWLICILLSIVSGLAGWFIRQHLIKTDLAAVNETVKTASRTIASLSSDLEHLNRDKTDVINQLHKDLSDIKNELIEEKRSIAHLKIATLDSDELRSQQILGDHDENEMINQNADLVEQLAALKDENIYLKGEIERIKLIELDHDKTALESLQKIL